MVLAILGRTWRLAARAWVRVLVAQLVVLALVALATTGLVLLGDVLLGASVDDVRDGAASGASIGRLLTIGLPLAALLAVVVSWGVLVPLRILASERLRGAATGAATGAPRLGLVLGAALAVGAALLGAPALLAVVAVVLVVPGMILVGSIAADPHGWGLSSAWRWGVTRPAPSLVALVAVVVALLVWAVVVAIAALGPLVAMSGMPAADARVQDVLDDAPLAVLIGAVLALAPLVVLPGALVMAVHDVATGRAGRDHDWDDDSGPAAMPTAELSDAARALVASPPPRPRRLAIPPRAAEPGRVPGPGVLAVAGVDLPVGRATRRVEAATLEFAVGDGELADTASSEQLWVSRDPLEAIPATWKRLAAGFAETGLWPLALPTTAADGASVDWFEHATRREAASLGDDPNVAQLVRSRLLESLAGGSPLRSTDLFARSATSRGELHQGSARRTDAIAATFEAIGAARLALVPTVRPADALHVLAWPGAAAAGVASDELSELLASWERRWGALLVGVGESHVILAVLRPPATFEEAVELAAEHHALCPDEAADWGDDQSAAQRLVDAPTWRLSWH